MKPRFFIFIFLFCFIFLTFSIKANAQSDYIKYVTTSLGENERIIHINYHTNASSSFVTYSTSSDLAGAQPNRHIKLGPTQAMKKNMALTNE